LIADYSNEASTTTLWGLFVYARNQGRWFVCLFGGLFTKSGSLERHGTYRPVDPGYTRPLEESDTTGAGLTGVGGPLQYAKARGGVLTTEETRQTISPKIPKVQLGKTAEGEPMGTLEVTLADGSHHNHQDKPRGPIETIPWRMPSTARTRPQHPPRPSGHKSRW
jgi:hypothetical protein